MGPLCRRQMPGNANSSAFKGKNQCHVTSPFVGGHRRHPCRADAWTQQVHHHRSVHCRVTGGGVSTDLAHYWHPARRSFLAPEVAIGYLVCSKLNLCKGALTSPSPMPLVVGITPCAREKKPLRYLARYVFRVAITAPSWTSVP